MSAQIFSACPRGFEGELVTIEGSATRGLPSFSLVGLANKTVNEARDRVRSALTQSGFVFPTRKVTLNLAPADLHKEGSHLDLPIALVVLLVSKQLRPADVEGMLFAGELALDGALRPVRGIINILEAGRRHGLSRAFVPAENLAQAALVPGIKAVGVESLTALYRVLKGEADLQALDSPKPVMVKNTKTGVRICEAKVPPSPAETAPSASDGTLGFDQIYGQAFAKRALTIAVAGCHNILLTGPPGTGKTTLARAASQLLPALSPNESLETTKLHSLFGTTQAILHTRPFRAPHHSASSRAIIGNAQGVPGEISLAHNGVLFLDELPEFRRDVLEALRQPLEDQAITLASVKQRHTYPARFMLIAAMNPCPCGHCGDPEHQCRCTPLQIQNYRRKLSGPLLDRFDLAVGVERVKEAELPHLARGVVKNNQSPEYKNYSGAKTGVGAHVKNTCSGTDTRGLEFWRRAVARASALQAARWGEHKFNGQVSSAQIAEQVATTPEATELLQAATVRLQLSTRVYFKTLRVAQTIADLEYAERIERAERATTTASATAAKPATSAPVITVEASHLAEALGLRQREAATGAA